jgi:hypothetical protein
MLRRLAIPVTVLGLLGAGCSGDGEQAAAPTPAPSTSGAGGSPSGSPSASATPAAQLPTGCDSMLPFTDLDRALGRPLFGQTVYTKGVAQPSIGRTGRVTCGYGLARTGRGAPPVEVGVSTYTDVESATRRVEATVSQLRSTGATQAEATVSGLPATVLGTGSSFTVLVAQGSRTIAVTVQRAVGGSADRAAVAVAERVVENLGQ